MGFGDATGLDRLASEAESSPSIPASDSAGEPRASDALAPAAADSAGESYGGGRTYSQNSNNVEGQGRAAQASTSEAKAVPPAGPPAASTAAAPPTTDAVREAASGAGGGPVEGIKVHGDWTIEVRDPDGSLVSRHEFSNALTTPGAILLSKLLARESTAGFWRVGLLSFLDSGPPCLSSLSEGVPCVITEITSPFTADNIFTTLTVAAPTSGPNVNKFVLTGTADAQRGSANTPSTVTVVNTQLYLCANTVTPVDCASSANVGLLAFTQTFLDTPDIVSVVTGQQIAVTVVISFSAVATP